ncbi:hypothetical protein [Bradyrhizobium genosp. P]|uniref:hypothetical protein n=1 Tax=Bradyrhizobium genosp. P TaxID=83641 RepID=UPI003CEA4106
MTFGPWSPGIDPAERLARLRSMRALALVHCRLETGFLESLQRAETDATALPAAFEQLERLPALRRRHLLATYAQLLGGAS